MIFKNFQATEMELVNFVQSSRRSRRIFPGPAAAFSEIAHKISILLSFILKKFTFISKCLKFRI